MSSSERVPQSMREKYEEIVALTDAFSEKHLNEEYAQIIRNAVAALCRKRPSPLVQGKATSWACGAAHAIGMANFLFDKANEPYIGSPDLYRAFGVGQSTGQGKSKFIRDTLNINHFNAKWLLRSRVDRNPLIWMLAVNGRLVDIREMPREVQEIAFSKGLIPYIPD